ncbi:mannitol dehydrogenase [Christensenellaceae bacterium OttesenSCG-928-K19]|nr:mannitol dehydrogenase [Christensenellaceae bacterium OttesenSCG-928-K19]
MKKAVMYGAGNIGRGFIGKVFSDSGYEVCFIDIDEQVIDAFNDKREYRVHIVSDEEEHYETVTNVYAVNAASPQAAQEIADCDIMATAVGVNVLPYIVENIAKGIALRMENGGGPLDVILAENQLDVDKIMREMIYKRLDAGTKAWTDKNLGLVEASIGRMVPPLTPKEKAADPLLIAVEPYAELPVDSQAFKNEIPDLVGLKPFSPFSFYIKRKLFLHNMGHAVCAYLGWQKRYEYISQAIRDAEIYDMTGSAMQSVVEALHREYSQIPQEEIQANKDDLLHRFHNRALKDTISRVANDPIRKLRSNDRLVGAALYCLEWDVEPAYIVKGIVAALCYDNEADEAAQKVQALKKEKGIDAVLEDMLSIRPSSQLAQLIKAHM